MTAQHAPCPPSGELRPKHLAATGRMRAAESIARIVEVTGLTNAEMGRAWGTCREIPRMILSGVRPLTYERILASPLSFRLAIAGEITADATPVGDPASGALHAVARVGSVAASVRDAISELGPGGKVITDQERPLVLREIDGAIETLRALRVTVARGGKGR